MRFVSIQLYNNEKQQLNRFATARWHTNWMILEDDDGEKKNTHKSQMIIIITPKNGKLY